MKLSYLLATLSIFAVTEYQALAGNSPLERMLGRSDSLNEAADTDKAERAKRAAAELAAKTKVPFRYVYSYSSGANLTFEGEEAGNPSDQKYIIRRAMSQVTKLVSCLSHPEDSASDISRVEFVFLSYRDDNVPNNAYTADCPNNKPNDKGVCVFVPPGASDASVKSTMLSTGAFIQLKGMKIFGLGGGDKCEEKEPYKIQLADGVPDTTKNKLSGKGADSYRVNPDGTINAVIAD